MLHDGQRIHADNVTVHLRNGHEVRIAATFQADEDGYLRITKSVRLSSGANSIQIHNVVVEVNADEKEVGEPEEWQVAEFAVDAVEGMTWQAYD